MYIRSRSIKYSLTPSSSFLRAVTTFTYEDILGSSAMQQKIKIRTCNLTESAHSQHTCMYVHTYTCMYVCTYTYMYMYVYYQEVWQYFLYRDDLEKKWQPIEKEWTDIDKTHMQQHNQHAFQVVMNKTLCSVWLTFVQRENETVLNCLIVLQYWAIAYTPRMRGYSEACLRGPQDSCTRESAGLYPQGHGVRISLLRTCDGEESGQEHLQG